MSCGSLGKADTQTWCILSQGRKMLLHETYEVPGLYWHEVILALYEGLFVCCWTEQCHVTAGRHITLCIRFLCVFRKRRTRSGCKGPASYYLIDWLVPFGMQTIMWHQAAKICSSSAVHRPSKQMLLHVCCFVLVLQGQKSRRNLTHESQNIERMPEF